MLINFLSYKMSYFNHMLIINCILFMLQSWALISNIHLVPFLCAFLHLALRLSILHTRAPIDWPIL